MVLPVVLVLLALGSLVIVPSLGYASTSLATGSLLEEKARGIYAAESGVEDALWRLMNDTPESFPFTYQLTGLNDLTVDVVIDEVTELFGEENLVTGDHSDWVIITKTITYDAGIYDYTFSVSNNGEGNLKLEQIFIDFPPAVDYVSGSTTGNITNDDPAVGGDSNTGITLNWELGPPHPNIDEGQTKDLIFQLSGPPDVDGVEGHSYIQATREDVGTVWDGDSHPYVITAGASDAGGAVMSVRAGLWLGEGTVEITCWQVNP